MHEPMHGETSAALPDATVTAATGERPTRPAIMVVGDTAVDWMLVVPSAMDDTILEQAYQWEARNAVHLVAQPGSAAFLSALLTTCVAGPMADAGPVDIIGPDIPSRALTNPNQTELTRTYSVWRLYPTRTGSREPALRMHEYLGRKPGSAAPLPAADRSDATPACLVIDDTGLRFRDEPNEWPACLRQADLSPAQILLKMTNPLATGPLWQCLMRDHADVLTLYCSVNDLRKESAPIGQPLSWERASADAVKAITGRADFAGVRRVIVSLGLSGAVIVERDGPQTLVFDPAHQEGDWERLHPGIPFGLGTCMMAALALECHRHPHGPDWSSGVRRGLAAARALHAHGYPLAGDHPQDDPWVSYRATVESLIGDPATDADAFQAVAVPPDDQWTIFSTTFAEGYRAVAARIAIEGDTDAVSGLPVERMGAWASVDRTEIESMRSVRNIIAEYLSQSHRSRPLSLAVFGPPGAGKSFAIKQMARQWAAGGVAMTVLEFNLSQFRSAAALPAALQRVRDCAVDGALPLVFWDEFDTIFEGRPLGWLAQFLAPMQDGAFVEDGVQRPIGPAIFIFAGGTHATLESFKTRAVEVPGAKATDFLSRLRGYVDVLGPNPMGNGDETYMLRRALLLRAMVRGRAPQMVTGGRLDIDPGVLRAFLDVGTYVHGARSMESIVEMSALMGKARYERSALPARHQLGLHVDAEEFLRLVAIEAAG